jgi:hypothetical protein
MTSPLGFTTETPVPAHSVQVESSEVRVYEWTCFTCGHTEHGYLTLRACEEAADAHGTNGGQR